VEVAVKTRNKRIGVLMGGRAAERNASLRSGRRVLRCLLDYGLSAEGVDLVDPRQLLDLRLDIAFLTLCGGEGEDGTVQTLLELCGIAYTGAGALTSALCSNRVMAKRILGHAGVPTPRFVSLSSLEGAHLDLDRVRGRLPFPVIVRSALADAGVEPRVIGNEAEFLEAVPKLKERGVEILAEEVIRGQPLRVGLIGEDVLPPVDAPAGPSQASVVALDARVESAVRRVARRAFDAVGCFGQGQAELILDEAGIPWVTRIRTLPLLDEGSSYEAQALLAGCRFDELVLRIVEGASLKGPARAWLQKAGPAGAVSGTGLVR
jgi:D-alanine-D-alanine ligase